MHFLAVEVLEDDENGGYGSDYGGAGIEDSKYAHIAMFQPGRARQVSSTAQHSTSYPQASSDHTTCSGGD